MRKGRQSSDQRLTEAAYAAIHWGTPTEETREMRAPAGTRGTPVAELVAISYLSVKADKPEVFRHAFDKLDGRGPYLLEAGEGKHRYPATPEDIVCLGEVIDLEVIDPDGGDNLFVITPFYFVCSTTDALTDAGGPVILASPYGADFAIEVRRNQPFIREHGIIG